MSAADKACFYTFDLSGFLGLPFATALKFKQQWDTFNRIQSFNLNVSTLRHAGDKGLAYYQYQSFAEQGDFITGQSLHVKRYPTANWNSVPND